jgi:hypothetical protein
MLRARRALNRRWALWIVALGLGGAIGIVEDLHANARAKPLASLPASPLGAARR